MVYSDFTFSKVKAEFGLLIDETRNLFATVDEVTPSDFLKQALEEYLPLATAINTEKARSELLIAPIMTEVRRQAKHQVSLFSGTDFNVDQSKGLVGFCNFIISGSREQFDITAPVLLLKTTHKE